MINLEEGSNYRKCCVDDHTSLSDDEKEVIQLNFSANIIPETSHSEHSNKYSNTCETVKEQFRNWGNLNSDILHKWIRVRDENKKDYEGYDDDHKDEDSTKHASVCMATVNTVMLASFFNHGVCWWL